MSVSQTDVPEAHRASPLEIEGRSRSQVKWVAVVIVAFSLIYFVDVILRASEKYFWYDELFTVYLCQLPGLGALWNALRHGADFNPPLFYVITKASQAIFGPGLIGTRLPEMVGFWALSVSLFWFVYRRGGIFAGLTALLLPSLTGAFYYAYEARPFGLVMGFSGLALVCWQMTLENRNRRWLTGFSLCLFACFLVHCYALTVAVPFVLAEIFGAWRLKQFRWSALIAIFVPALLAIISFGPLFVSYRALTKGTGFQAWFPPGSIQIPNFYLFLLSPCIALIIFTLALLAVDRALGTSVRWLSQSNRDPIPGMEIVLGLSFLALPIFGVILGQIVHGPFFARYFVSAVIGICILVGLAIGRGKHFNWVASAVALVTLFSTAWHSSAMISHRIHGISEVLNEPSSGFFEHTTLSGPLEHYSLLIQNSGESLPIAVLEPLDFLYLVNYAPRLVPRLYFVSPSNNDFFQKGFVILRPWCPVAYNPPLAYPELLRLSPEFLLFGASQIQALHDIGTTQDRHLESFRSSEGRFLAKIRKRSSPF